MPEHQTQPSADQREAQLAAREAALAAREAELEAREAEAARAAQDLSSKPQGLLNNGNPAFQNPKEKIYDHFPLSVHQMDILIAVLVALIAVFVFLGVNHISFFGLF